ncbi:MAG: DUF3822 family protein [Porphyromonas sp.]|nr:DUF3822 family protein [Porphyromonas sp.]
MPLPDRLPSLLNIETAEQYSVSIRLRAGGLAFVLHSKELTQELYAETFDLQTGHPDYKSGIEDLYFRYPFLSYPYHSVRIYYEPLVYSLVPADLYDESRAALWLQPIADEKKVGTAHDWEVYTVPLQDKRKLIVSAADKPLMQFLRRSMLVTKPEIFLSPIIEEQGQLSRKNGYKQLSVVLRQKGFDCMLFDDGELVLLNSFPLSTDLPDSIPGELMYYIMLLWRTYECNQEQDSLIILPDEPSLRSTATKVQLALHRFIRQISLA